MKPPLKDLPKGDAGLAEGPLAQLNDPPRRGMEIAGVGLSLAWVILILVYVLVTPPGSETRTLGLIMTLLMVFLPIALIWAVVITLRSIRELRAEAKRLQATVDAMRSSYVQAQSQGNGLKPSVEKKLDEIAASTREAQTVLATFTSRRDAALSVPSADRKAALVQPRPEPASEEGRPAGLASGHGAAVRDGVAAHRSRGGRRGGRCAALGRAGSSRAVSL